METQNKIDSFISMDEHSLSFQYTHINTFVFYKLTTH